MRHCALLIVLLCLTPFSIAQTPALQRAAATVHTEVQSWGATSALAPEYLYALSAMSYVQSRLSSANYAALQSQGKLPANMDAEKCLALEAGLCGSHVDTFDKLLTACAAPVRRRAVEWYIHDERARNNRNHVAIEVFYGGRWRLFDVTSATVFPSLSATKQDDLMSAADVMAEAKAEPSSRAWRSRAVTNAALVWNRQAAQAGADAFEQFARSEVDVLYGRRGTIHFRANRDATTYDLSNLLTQIGQTADYCGNFGDVTAALDPHALGNGKPEGKRELEIVLNGAATTPVPTAPPTTAPGAAGATTTPPTAPSLLVRCGESVLYRAALTDLKAGEPIGVPLAGHADAITIAVEPAGGVGGLVDVRSITAR